MTFGARSSCVIKAALCMVHCKIFSTSLGLYPLDASSMNSPHSVTMKMSSDTPKCPLGQNFPQWRTCAVEKQNRSTHNCLLCQNVAGLSDILHPYGKTWWPSLIENAHLAMSPTTYECLLTESSLCLSLTNLCYWYSWKMTVGKFSVFWKISCILWKE